MPKGLSVKEMGKKNIFVIFIDLERHKSFANIPKNGIKIK